uniref:hypothetical protein n=1 Tax=Phocaeicola coprophilus TaxID=387090 RepID=UPI00267108F5
FYALICCQKVNGYAPEYAAASIIVGVGEYGLIIQSTPKLEFEIVAPECIKISEISFCNPLLPVTNGLYIESSYH